MTSPGQPRRAPELRLPYPLLEYLLKLPGDYAKLALRLLQRAQWTPGTARDGLAVDAGEVLISLRSDDVWGAISLDRDIDEDGRVSLLRRVLKRLERDALIAVRPARQGVTAADARSGTRRDTPATIVRFLKYRDNLWPRNADATRETARGPTREAARPLDTIPAEDPADPASPRIASRSAAAETCAVWREISGELRRTIRPELFERWFAPLTATRNGEELLLLAPNRFHQAFVEDNYRAFLEQRLAGAAEAPLRVRVAAALVA